MKRLILVAMLAFVAGSAFTSAAARHDHPPKSPPHRSPIPAPSALADLKPPKMVMGGVFCDRSVDAHVGGRSCRCRAHAKQHAQRGLTNVCIRGGVRADPTLNSTHLNSAKRSTPSGELSHPSCDVPDRCALAILTMTCSCPPPARKSSGCRPTPGQRMKFAILSVLPRPKVTSAAWLRPRARKPRGAHAAARRPSRAMGAGVGAHRRPPGGAQPVLPVPPSLQEAGRSAVFGETMSGRRRHRCPRRRRSADQRRKSARAACLRWLEQ